MAILSSYTGYNFRWVVNIITADSEERVTFKNGDTIIYASTDNLGYGTVDIPFTGTWQAYIVEGRDVQTLTVPNATSVNLPSAWTFNKCTWEEIHTIADAGNGQKYWNTGDSKDGVYICHFLTNDQRGSSYYNTNGHIVMDFGLNNAWSARYGVGPLDYFTSSLATTITSFYNGLPSTGIKSILYPFSCWVGNSNHTGGNTQTVYLAAPSVVEVGGTNAYNNLEATHCFKFDNFVFYRGTGGSFWLRSPANSGWNCSLGTFYNAYCGATQTSATFTMTSSTSILYRCIGVI